MDNGRFELRLTGSGGQGLILASIIVAEAAIAEGKVVTQSQVYGAEARGGTTKAELIISDRHIAYPKVTDPDLVAALTNEGLKQYGGGISRKTVVVIDSSTMALPESLNEEACKTLLALPIRNATVEKLGSELGLNVVLLGIIQGLTEVVSVEALRTAVSLHVKKQYVDLNMRALDLGIEMVRESATTGIRI
ncbi:MAG: 2-oxoacid:acceptor oxidoreductase family protein [Caldisericota bacterium]|jgi:2-oxoglutarate ferredoxin oxidoreductase subunit gamma|nr:2-oxoacid:acceptor oxidoreductase family protein [Caldisericota bacterium]